MDPFHGPCEGYHLPHTPSSSRPAAALPRHPALCVFLLALAMCASAHSQALLPACSPANRTTVAPNPNPEPEPLIVVGFLGGNVKAANMVHKEAQLARHLQLRYGSAIHASVFSNGDKRAALREILHQLDRNGDGCLSLAEKSSARIVLYGHSWGASEAIALAGRLNGLGIPVLLTVQVDSVQKPTENDALIPPNVREAVNFYQTQGLLHGRRRIQASDPKRTTILGNFESSYRTAPVPLDGYPWFARTFMKPHIEIENDPAVWDKVEALIGAQVR